MDKCWLCLGMGGIAIHYLWSERRGKPLWTAHEYLCADTHPIRPCPVCTSVRRDLPRGNNDHDA